MDNSDKTSIVINIFLGSINNFNDVIHIYAKHHRFIAMKFCIHFQIKTNSLTFENPGFISLYL